MENTYTSTFLAQANATFRNKDYKSAITIYEKALENSQGPLAHRIEFNRSLAIKRLNGLTDSTQSSSIPSNTVSTERNKNLPTTLLQSSEICSSIVNNWWNSPFYAWSSPRPPTNNSKRRISDPHIKMLKGFGAAFLGPVLASFYSRLCNRLNESKEIKKIWFLAREGYLLESGFNRFASLLDLQNIETSYLFCSRTLLFRISLFNEEIQHKTLQHSYNGTLHELFRNRFAFSSDEIWDLFLISPSFRSHRSNKINLPNDKRIVMDVLKESAPYLKNKFLQKSDSFKEYLNAIGFGKNPVEHVVDLGYTGTIQSLLTDLTNTPTNGHYFITTKKATDTARTRFNGYLAERVNFGEGNMLLDRSLFLESILTAPHGQVVDISKPSDGALAFHFGETTNAQRRYGELEIIFDGAIDYALFNLKNENIMSSKELVSYYANFFGNLSLFPRQTTDIFELDDSISGNGIINPLLFF